MRHTRKKKSKAEAVQCCCCLTTCTGQTKECTYVWTKPCSQNTNTLLLLLLLLLLSYITLLNLCVLQW